ncbi:ABC transporter ATP-binding protein [Desulfomonile tiedjei]|uniref:Amino acid/amide ABC transporter ATP-binding protein 2, HAAT family n=1 Tax=Desulfomonile tiedjei (strain ATCC 49306 / DSM 6799 / DCB-1) TaxID=706587 RepID=I4CEY9_DESTA|nr:ABC transporter ATP-binding protein [Desulfomonile tiedjei]AFM28130.1 amino acid/amide ABC transporter ATP-binding protein 2, HAAT family [Desulfomonile tiedjei DSM 6799]
MLIVRDLHTSYGAIAALQGVSFEVPEGSVVALVGANGAGKSTTLNTISGLLRPESGSIRFGENEIAGWRPDRVTGLGLVQVPEGRQVLGSLTVEENLLLGAYTRKDLDVSRDLRDIYERFPHLKKRRRQIADSLSGGEQQMLVLGRALMARPKLLMLDEPSLGLAPLIVKEVFRIIAELKERTTILLVEQNARKALQVANYGYVLEGGRVVQEGPADQLQGDPRIVEAYLGRKQ